MDLGLVSKGVGDPLDGSGHGGDGGDGLGLECMIAVVFSSLNNSMDP